MNVYELYSMRVDLRGVERGQKWRMYPPGTHCVIDKVVRKASQPGSLRPRLQVFPAGPWRAGREVVP